MASQGLITTVRSMDGLSVIEIEGEVTGAAENALADAYTEASKDGVSSILLNFEKLEYLNSSGIGLLVTILIRAQRNRQKLLACGLSAHYQEIFQLTRLDEAIRIYPSKDEAIASL